MQIFAGAFPENYEPPSGFYFEVNDASPIVQVIFYFYSPYFPYLVNCIFIVIVDNCDPNSISDMKDNINLFDYNVQDRVNDFVAAAVAQVTN